MNEGNDGGAVFWMLLAAIVVAGIVVALCGCTLETPATDVPATDVGQPLDAIRYRPPTWAAGDSAWRVTDRQTGDEWWLVEMQTSHHTQWVALPRSDWEMGR